MRRGSVKLKTSVNTYTLRQMDSLTLKYTLEVKFSLPFLFSFLSLNPYYLVPISKDSRRKFFRRHSVLNDKIVLKANRRGIYEVGQFYLSVSDVLGIINMKHKIADPKDIFVFPFLVPFEKLKIHLSEPLEGLKAKYVVNPNYSYIAGARDYTQNDPISLIHWNQTAHRGKLTVKEFDFSASKRVIAMINLNSKSLKFKDYSTSLAASICYYAQKFHLPFGIIINSGDSIMAKFGSSDFHLMQIFKDLSIVETDGNGLNDLDFIKKSNDKIPFGAEVFYIDKSLDSDLRLAVLKLKKNVSKLNIVLLPDEIFILPHEKPPYYYFKESYYFEVFGKSQDDLAREGIFVYQILGKDYSSIMEI